MKNSIFSRIRHNHTFDLIALGMILSFALIPLFFSFPYRVNIFLSWEGAYRMYLDQMPFKDFGLPLGYGYWIIPTLFFKLFGPFMSSLIKAQIFINFLSGCAFLSILRSFHVKPAIRTLGVTVFCISYSFFNFWPWYNHSVIVFQLIGFAFLLKGIFKPSPGKYIFLVLAAFFVFLSFFTKQDGGGMAFLIMMALLIVHTLYEKKILPILVFLISLVIVGCVFILPLIPHDFGYWFNHGQEPHNSRLAIKDFADIIFGQSIWIKFYLLLIFFIIAKELKDLKTYLKDQQAILFTLFTLGILVEALLFQVTSYTPPNNNIFFHSFAFVFLLVKLPLGIDFTRRRFYILATLCILLWWSGSYWKYMDRVISRAFPGYAAQDTDKISVKTFVISTNTSNVGMDKWKFSGLKAFEKVYMPESTVNGIDRLLNHPDVTGRKDLKVLNMTELTPLAYEMPYEPETNLPLWYHVGVGMFDKEVDVFVERVRSGYYDIILFETIPYLNNFFPERVREAAMAHYEMNDRFLAPRRPTDSHIEVYMKPEKE